MERSFTTFICFLLVFCFTSCAIHDKFPFICFLPECVKRQYSLKGFKKRLSANIAMNRNKRERRRIAVQRKKEKHNVLSNKNPISVKKSSDADTVEYGRTIVYTKYQMVFSSAPPERKDTLLVVHSSAEKHIMEDGRNQIYELVRSRRAENIRSVVFKQVRPDQADKSEDPSVVKPRIEKVKKFVAHQGVDRGKISCTDAEKQ
jgi:hypothetical protein